MATATIFREGKKKQSAPKELSGKESEKAGKSVEFNRNALSPGKLAR